MLSNKFSQVTNISDIMAILVPVCYARNKLNPDLLASESPKLAYLSIFSIKILDYPMLEMHTPLDISTTNDDSSVLQLLEYIAND